MTYTDLYRPAIQEYLSKWNSYYDAFAFRSVKDSNIVQLQEEVENLEKQLAAIVQNKPAPFEYDLTAALNKRFEDSIAAFEKAQADAYQAAEMKKQRCREEALARKAEADAISQESVKGLTEKYNALLSYKESVKDAIARYNIQPSDLVIDEDNITRDDMEHMLDVALKACKSIGGDRVRQNLKILYEFEDDADQDTRTYRMIAILALLVLGGPIILLGLFGYSVYKLLDMYPNREGLRLADKLMYGVDCSKFRDAPQYDETVDVDMSVIDAELEEKLQQMEAVNPRNVQEQIQSEINKQHTQIADEYRAATNTVMARYDKMVEAWESRLKELRTVIDEYVSKLTPFGTTASTVPIMDTQWVLGKAKGVIDVKYDVGLRNIVFANKSPEMVMFMKLLLSNALLSVVPKNLSVVVYDPESLGADFATFMTQETNEYIQVVTKDYQKVFDSYRDYAQATFRLLNQQNINEYNQQAFDKGMVTRDYKLLILYSGIDRPAENKLLMEFMNISARAGVFVWLVHPKAVTNCTFYSTPFEGVESPFPISPDIFNTVMSTYIDAYLHRKDSAISYTAGFAEKYMPPEKWWQENTDKGIKLNAGLQDGDPSKGYALELGDANVHCLCAGASGAGKSAFLNQMLVTLMCRYAPSTLELVMVDFKNAEFKTGYSNLTTHYSAIPHPKILAGTKDGEYAVSIFDYLISEMDRRTVLFGEAGVKKLETYNQKMRQMGTPEKCLPRILVVIDEFQVMFTEVDQKCVDLIQARIRSLSKLARFCGCHMLFVSQSMTGTMPKDVKDQFSMRMCLRASSDVSSDIIGSPVSSKIKSKFGYIYTNTNAGEIQDSTHLWRIPYISEPELADYVSRIMEKCKTEGEIDRHAYFYDESEQFSSALIAEHVTRIREAGITEPRLFVLGERTSFSLNKAPVNFCLKRLDGENLLFYSFEEQDFTNLCMTLMQNVQLQPNATLLVNCADPDLFTILDFESWYDKQFLDIARPMQDVSPWLDQLTAMIEERQQMSPTEYSPLYFFCLRWDKQLGICRDEQYRQVDKLKAIFMNGPAVDIHVILGVQLFKEVPGAFLGMFNHFICAKGPEDASYKYLGSARAQKLPQELGFAIYRYGSEEKKFKIYQHEFRKKAEAREVAL